MIGVGDEVLGYRIAAPAALPEAGRWWTVDGADGASGDAVWVRVSDPEHGEDPRAVELAWERLRHLDHPVVPRVVAFERAEGALALAAPRGVSLADLLALRLDAAFAMTPGTVLDVATQLSDMLVHAHERGRPHGHLSPEVIRVTDDGRLIVWGYGVGPETPCVSGWWSPERARGRRASGDADQWALGALVAQLVTGRGPWRGDDPDASARVGDPAPVAAMVLEQWAPLGRLVERAMALEPRDRFPSVHPLRQAFFALAQRARQESDLGRMATTLRARNAGVEAPPIADVADEAAPSEPIEAASTVAAEASSIGALAVEPSPIDAAPLPVAVAEEVDGSADAPTQPGEERAPPRRSLVQRVPLVREAGRTGPAPIYVEEDLERDLPPVARSLEVLPDPARYVELDAGTSPTAVPGTSADGTVWSEPPVVHEDGPPERTPLRAERIDIGPPPVARDPVDIRRIAPFFVGLMILLLVAYVWSVA